MKNLHDDITHRGYHANFIHTEYETSDGEKRAWEWVQRKNKQNAVVIAALVDEGVGLTTPKLVVIKEYRVPLADYQWGVPAGLIDAGETPEEAAKRELYEETGLKMTELLEPPTPLIYNSAGLTDEGVHIVFCKAEGSVSSDHQENSEEIQVELFSIVDILDLIDNPKVKIGAKAYLIFRMYLTRQHPLWYPTKGNI